MLDLHYLNAVSRLGLDLRENVAFVPVQVYCPLFLWNLAVSSRFFTIVLHGHEKRGSLVA